MFEKVKKVDFGNAEEYYSKLYLAFNLTIGLSLLPFAFIFLDVLHKDVPSLVVGNLRFLILSIFFAASVVTYYTGYQKFKLGTTRVGGLRGLREKMKAYYECHLDKFIWFAFSSVLSIIGLVLTRSMVFIVTYLFTLGSLSIYRPTLKGLIKKLMVSEDDKQTLLDNSYIA